jgi:L-lactate utilization protein LutC
MKNKKYHIVDTLPKSNIKIVERGKTDTGNTQAQKRSLSLLGTGHISLVTVSLMRVTLANTFNISETEIQNG